MLRAEADVEDYFNEMDDYTNCISREHDEAVAEANRVLDEWNHAVKMFNLNQ